MKRRAFVNKGLAGMAALPLAALHASPSTSKQISFEAKLTGHEADLTLAGSNNWTQDSHGILYSPIWDECVVGKGRDLLRREDYAYFPGGASVDASLDFEFRDFCWSQVCPGMVFRAQDSFCCYVVDFGGLGGKSAKYLVRLWKQDSSGYRRGIASGLPLTNPSRKRRLGTVTRNTPRRIRCQYLRVEKDDTLTAA